MLTSEAGSSVLANYYRQQFSFATPSVEFIGNGGGFSGARLWVVQDQSQRYCLRCWPDDKSVSKSRLGWIHGQLQTAFQNGCGFVPVPCPADDGETVVKHEGRFWQLEPWMPGVPDFYDTARNEKLFPAMRALAQFHEATSASTESASEQTTGTSFDVSPSLMARHKLLSTWFNGKQITDRFQQLRWCLANKTVAAQRAHPEFDWSVLGTRMTSHFGLVAGHVRFGLAAEINSPVRQQTIIGDVWHDHVLFTGDAVTGMVDFGSMKIDTVACDVARLLGSLVDDYTKTWERAISVYGDATADPRLGVCQEFHNLVRVFDISTTAMSGLNWLEWLFVDERSFDDYRAIANRLRRIAFRLEKLLGSL